jgi:hypothetical protein
VGEFNLSPGTTGQREGKREARVMSRMFMVQADRLTSALIVHGYPQFASARVSSVAARAVEDADVLSYGLAIECPVARHRWTDARDN